MPCDGCTACCRSSQFVHIEPDELDTLAHVPTELQFPAPGRPQGHVVLGYDEQGHCPMLVDDRCSIYAHRPRACRIYDCRVFPAAGVTPDKPLIAERAGRWEFTYRDGDAKVEHEAVRAAARFVEDRPDVVPGAPRSRAPARSWPSSCTTCSSIRTARPRRRRYGSSSDAAGRADLRR